MSEGSGARAFLPVVAADPGFKPLSSFLGLFGSSFSLPLPFASLRGLAGYGTSFQPVHFLRLKQDGLLVPSFRPFALALPTHAFMRGVVKSVKTIVLTITFLRRHMMFQFLSLK